MMTLDEVIAEIKKLFPQTQFSVECTLTFRADGRTNTYFSLSIADMSYAGTKGCCNLFHATGISLDEAFEHLMSGLRTHQSQSKQVFDIAIKASKGEENAIHQEGRS